MFKIISLLALGSLVAQVAAQPVHARSLEARVPHLDYTYDDQDGSAIGLTYAPEGVWYHETYNPGNATLSFSNDANASYTFSTSEGAVDVQIWAGKKVDRGNFSVYIDSVYQGWASAYDPSFDGTEPQMLWSARSAGVALDTAPHTYAVVNAFDSTLNTYPYLTLDFIIESD